MLSRVALGLDLHPAESELQITSFTLRLAYEPGVGAGLDAVETTTTQSISYATADTILSSSSIALATLAVEGSI